MRSRYCQRRPRQEGQLASNESDIEGTEANSSQWVNNLSEEALKKPPGSLQEAFRKTLVRPCQEGQLASNESDIEGTEANSSQWVTYNLLEEELCEGFLKAS